MYMQGNNFKLTKAKQLTLINSSFVTVTLIFTSSLACNYRVHLILDFEQPGLCKLSHPQKGLEINDI